MMLKINIQMKTILGDFIENYNESKRNDLNNKIENVEVLI
jgi:hypothetical protein